MAFKWDDFPEAVLVGVDAMQAEGIAGADKILPAVKRKMKKLLEGPDRDIFSVNVEYARLMEIAHHNVVLASKGCKSTDLLIETIDLEVHLLSPVGVDTHVYSFLKYLVQPGGWIAASDSPVYLIIGNGSGSLASLHYDSTHRLQFKYDTWADVVFTTRRLLTASQWYTLEDSVGAIVDLRTQQYTLYSDNTELLNAWAETHELTETTRRVYDVHGRHGVQPRRRR